MKKLVGLFGGTFDPIHNGHLQVAEAAIKQMNLAKVYFLPTSRNPFKDKPTGANDKQRACMIFRALDSGKRFNMNAILTELTGYGPTYTIDAMDNVAKYFGEEFPNYKPFWIIGSDQLPDLPKWKRIEELASRVEFICVSRAGAGTQAPARPVIDNLKIHYLSDVSGISSTLVRSKLQAGEDVSDLIPPGVLAYIKEHKLYEKQN